MGVVNEKDMLIKEVMPDYKFWDKVYARYPLIGNAIFSDTNIEKINKKAKEALDKLVEKPTLASEVPTFWHQLITISTINYAKRWNAYEESRFTKYITLQFGYRDDNGKIWGIIANSIEKSLSVKKRFFLKDKGGREFYETVLVHSFAPENSWDSVFDLLYDFLKNNLRWNYIAGDPIVGKMIYALCSKLNGNTVDDEDLIISSMEYRVRLGAKRLLQNRPEYTTELFDHILGRISDLVQNQASEPKQYIDILTDEWFAKKISRMVEKERSQINRGARVRIDTALSYSKIRPRMRMKDGRVIVHMPAIRLEESGHRYAEVKIYDGEKVIGKAVPEIYGNELGETINECDIPLSFSTEAQCDLNAKVYCDSTIIYDSKRTLSKKILIFKNGKECSINSLVPGEYEMYIPESEKYKFENADIIVQNGRYLKVFLSEDFSILYCEKIIAMDASNIQETTISEPVFLPDCRFNYEGEEYLIAEETDTFKLYADSSTLSSGIKMFCNEQEILLDNYWENEGDAAVCEIPLKAALEYGSLSEVTFINLQTSAVLYKKVFVMVETIDISFNNDFYVLAADFENAHVTVKIGEIEIQQDINQGDIILAIPYKLGEIAVHIPAVNYTWIDIDKIYSGNNIWRDDVVETSTLSISAASNIEVYVEIGDYRYRTRDINLFNIVKDEGFSAHYNFPIILIVNEQRYKIGQLIFTEMFTNPPVITSDNDYIYWDGGISYIGGRDCSLELQLLSEDDVKYRFKLAFETSQLSLPDGFEDGEYTYQIVKPSDEEVILAQDILFFGNPNKLRFLNKTIEITDITEDVGEGSRPQTIKSVYVEQIHFIERTYVPSEDGIFDIYEGQMYFVRPDGSKKYYSRKYYDYKNTTYYKVNPVRIIYINDKLLRIVNEDEEGLYCFNNVGTYPSLEITDREPRGNAKNNYKDILFYLYGTNSVSVRHSIASTSAPSKVVAVTQTYSNNTSIFDRFECVEQSCVIEAPVSNRILINAGPGTGKTWTLIEKIINLVDVQGVDPEAILILCFSKAAVEVIKGRLSDAANGGRVSEIINLVDVRTFDSFASQLLYWVKEESDYDNLQYYNISKLNYDERIQLFTSIIKELPELIEQCCHLFVDEVQDLVKDRARMVLEMIRALPTESGITLMGDSCQSIYDYQTGNDNMTSSQFYKVMCERMPNFHYYTFDRNYRQDYSLAKIGDDYRRFILSGNCKNCDSYWNSNVAKEIDKFGEYDATKITEYHLQTLMEKGTVGILTRTNGQALKISAALREKGIEHVLRKRLSDNSLNKWIAILLNSFSHSSISYDEFVDLYTEIIGDGNNVNLDSIWSAIMDASRCSSERIGVRELLRGLLVNARNPILYSEEQSSLLTVSNIHRGKGREFDTVLVEDDIFSEEEKPLDEHKVCYVALTRPKTSVYRVNAKAEYMRIDKDGDRRCFKTDFVGFNKQLLTYFEIGLSQDVDMRSFVRLEGVQEYIRSHCSELIGKRVVLSKDRHASEYVRYNIVLDETGLVLGNTSIDFYESLTRALRSVYNLSYKKTVYYNVYPDRFSGIYIDDVVSLVDKEDGSECGITTYGDMVSWSALNIVGYSKVEYV